MPLLLAMVIIAHAPPSHAPDLCEYHAPASSMCVLRHLPPSKIANSKGISAIFLLRHRHMRTAAHPHILAPSSPLKIGMVTCPPRVITCSAPPRVYIKGCAPSFFFVFGSGEAACREIIKLPCQDILALLEFRKGIKHDPTDYVLQSWNEESIHFNSCPPSWNDIMCNRSNIAAVVLDNMSLMLVKLSMANNSIAGQMPKKTGDFKIVEYLDISNNLFNSSLPAGIGKIGSLQNLSLN